MEQTASILNGYYKNAAVGIDAIEAILPKAKNETLCKELHKQLQYYKDQKALLNEQMLQSGITPESQGTMAKLMTEMNVKMHSIGGIDTKEIAKLMVEGTNMGIIQMTQLMNENTSVSDALRRQGKEMIRREEAYIERLKPYL
ncbi:MAG: hypothetical protein IJ512_05070 [Ruminococcus sp.]|nr:hypothetical protein [Ruminococcus sp.]